MNTLKYAKNLEAVGFSREQAEMTVVILNEVIENSLATKQDLTGHGSELRQEMKDLGAELRQEIGVLRHEIQQMRSELVIKLGAMMLSGMAVVAGIVSALNTLL